jgi:uncharacterized protein with HEPN domain
MLKPDIVRLQHMFDAANEALSFIADKSKNDLESDRTLALALVKSIEIFGEAASKVSRELRSQCPDGSLGEHHRYAKSPYSQLRCESGYCLADGH